MKKIIGVLLSLFLPSLAHSAVHIQQGDNALLGSVTASSVTVTGAGIRFPDGTIQVSSPSTVSTVGGGITSPGSFTWTNTSGGMKVSSLTVTSGIFMNDSFPNTGNSLLKYYGSDGSNFFLGSASGSSFTGSGSSNSCLGSLCMNSLTTGSSNNCIGTNCLLADTSGSNNLTSGILSGGTITSGSGNVAVGALSGYGLVTGSSSTFLGYNATTTNNAISNGIAIGANAIVTTNNTTVLGGSPGTYNTQNLIVSSVTVAGLTSGQCVQTGTGGLLTVTGSACGTGSTLTTATNTWTAQQTFGNIVTVSSHVVVTSSNPVSAVKVTANGTYGTTNGTSGGLLVDCTGGGTASGMCSQFYTNAGAQSALGGIVNVISDNSAWNEPQIYTSRNNSNFNSDVLIDAVGYPALTLRETAQSNPSAKKWQWSVHNGVLRFENRLNDDSGFGPYLQISSATFWNDAYFGPTYGNQSNFSQVGIQASTGNVYALTITTSTSNIAPYLMTLSTAGSAAFSQSITAASGSITNNLSATSVTASSFTLTGGTGNFSFTSSDGNTYQVVGSSTVPTVGHYAVWSSSNSLIDGGTGSGGSGTPGGSTGQVQYNSAGSFAGSSKFQFNGTSTTFTSSVTINTQNGNAPAENDNIGLLNVFNDNSANNTTLFSVGSNNGKNQFYVPDQNPVAISNGVIAGSVGAGKSSLPDSIYSTNSNNNQINLYSGDSVTGEMMLQTGGSAGQNIVMKPMLVETVRLSSTSTTFQGSVTVRGPIAVSTTIASGNLLSLTNSSGVGNPFTVDFNHIATASKYNILNSATQLGTGLSGDAGNEISLVNTNATSGNINLHPSAGNNVNVKAANLVVDYGIVAATATISSLASTVLAVNASGVVTSTSVAINLPAGTLIPEAAYGSGIDSAGTVSVSSGVPACREEIYPYNVTVSSVSFWPSGATTAHVAIGFYDSSCTLVRQSTVTLAGQNPTTVFFGGGGITLSAGVKYFVCHVADATTPFFMAPVDVGYTAVTANAGEPATNYHIFTAGNSSANNGSNIPVLPSSCGTRSSYSSGTRGTIGYAFH